MEAILKVDQDALPVLKSGLELKRNALKFNLRRYQDRLTQYEQTHRMTSEQFAAKFSSGELGDEREWFEWEFALDAVRETERQMNLLGNVKL